MTTPTISDPAASGNRETAMKDSNDLNNYYKVPFRDVYCVTRWKWIKAVFRCHVWLRLGGR